MCGICLRVRLLTLTPTPCSDAEDSDWVALVTSVRRRGPDQTRCVATSGFWPRLDVDLAASVLGLRGAHIVPQPLHSRVGPQHGLLVWNGQIFACDDRPRTVAVDTALHHLFAALAQGANDGQALLEAADTLVLSHACVSVAVAICAILDHIDGPYAFCFLSDAGAVYGRDPLGRRSLLHSLDLDRRTFLLASCGAGTAHAFTEVACDSYFLLRPLEGGMERVVLPRSRQTWTLPCPDPSLCPVPSGRSSPSPSQKENGSPRPKAAGPGADMVSQLLNVLRNAVASRLPPIHCRPAPASDVSDQDQGAGPSTSANVSTALLFSGGVDCTLLAVLAHEHLPSDQAIDLLNVAFDSAQGYDTPDRQTARQALAELQTLHPERQWRLVEINVTRDEYAAERQKVLDLMAPNDTVMDLSIASALYFAARGQNAEYTTPARVLLSGLGADELFGGYQRHRLAYERCGYAGLRDELQLDLERLPERNLGRDDRVISASGREARFPFLALAVVRFVARLPTESKAFYSTGADGRTGDKRLLRDVARVLGLRDTAERAKRAIQFGSRSAKLDGPAGGKHARGVRKVQ